MKIRRFVAKDMRTALAQIKEELGADAVIMSNKKIPEGVELMAAIDYSHSVPDAIPQATNAVQASANAREVSNDVVDLTQHHQQANAVQEGIPTTAFGQNITSNYAASHIAQNVANGMTNNSVGTQNNNVDDHAEGPVESIAPADSLSALLNRQVQHAPASQEPVQQSIQPHSFENTNNQIQSSADEQSIEQQLRSFTERLSQSTVEQGSQENSSGNHFTTADAEHLARSSQANQQMNQRDFSSSSSNEQGNVNSADFNRMQEEMASIRQLLEHQVSGLMWQDMAQKDPRRAVLVNRLLSLGLNEQIADQIAGYVPAQAHEHEAWSQATQLIAQQLNTTQNDIIHRGGVVALVGPTGVGKTTTIAKLAARYAQMHGADQVALISTDTYRIAGFEQLETYGRIIGCHVKLAKDSQTLDALLQQFANKKLILIDTAGMGQRDMRLAEHLTALISNSRVRIRNYLVLAANSQQQVMQENVERFKKVPLAGCIFTKLDESVSVGEIITTSILNGLPIGYLTDGQRVPEDIKVANSEKLVNLADKMASKLATNNVVPLRFKPVAPAAVI